MLPKAQRLTRDNFAKRPLRNVPFPFGSLKLLEGKAKAAVVVSKKIAPRAVTRNLIRRRIYAILREEMKKGRLQHALVVYPNKRAVAAPFAALKTELERALAHC